MITALPLETRLLVKETVKDTVEEVLLRFGIDGSTPEAVLELQRDWHHLRTSRLNSESQKNKTSQHVLNVIVSGLIAALVVGISDILGIGR